MARIADVEIERLKGETDLVALVEAAGVKLEKRGADRVGRCPFHDDQTPSLVITPGKNLWRCFGACDVGGDAVAWVMKCEGVSFRHAVELLKGGHAPAADKAVGAAPIRSRAVKLAPIPAPAEDAELLEEVVGFYHQTLRETPEALAYLERRGAHPSGADRDLPAGLRRPHPGLPAAGRDAESRRRGCAAGCNGSACCARPATSICAARW